MMLLGVVVAIALYTQSSKRGWKAIWWAIFGLVLPVPTAIYYWYEACYCDQGRPRFFQNHAVRFIGGTIGVCLAVAVVLVLWISPPTSDALGFFSGMTGPAHLLLAGVPLLVVGGFTFLLFRWLWRAGSRPRVTVLPETEAERRSNG